MKRRKGKLTYLVGAVENFLNSLYYKSLSKLYDLIGIWISPISDFNHQINVQFCKALHVIWLKLLCWPQNFNFNWSSCPTERRQPAEIVAQLSAASNQHCFVLYFSRCYIVLFCRLIIDEKGERLDCDNVIRPQQQQQSSLQYYLQTCLCGNSICCNAGNSSSLPVRKLSLVGNLSAFCLNLCDTTAAAGNCVISAWKPAQRITLILYC